MRVGVVCFVHVFRLLFLLAREVRGVQHWGAGGKVPVGLRRCNLRSKYVFCIVYDWVGVCLVAVDAGCWWNVCCRATRFVEFCITMGNSGHVCILCRAVEC